MFYYFALCIFSKNFFILVITQIILLSINLWMYLMHWSYMFNIFKSIILRTSWFFRPQLASDKLSRIWMRVFTVKTMGNSDDRVFFCRVFHSKCWGGLLPRFQCALEKCKKVSFFENLANYEPISKLGWISSI